MGKLTIRFKTTMHFDSQLNIVVPLLWNQFDVFCVDRQIEIDELWRICIVITQESLFFLCFLVQNRIPCFIILGVFQRKSCDPSIGTAFNFQTCYVTWFKKVKLKEIF